MMRIVLLLAGSIGCSVIPAGAQTSGTRSECPPNTRPNGTICQLNMPSSLRNTGTCPADYVSTADGSYCVLAPRKEWVRAKPGCPGGYEASPGGEFCTER